MTHICYCFTHSLSSHVTADETVPFKLNFSGGNVIYKVMHLKVYLLAIYA